MMVWAWMLWSWSALGNKNGITVRARMLWSSRALGTRTELWFGHGCSGRHEECSGYSQASTSQKEDSSPETLYGSVARRGFDSRSGRSLQESAPALKVFQAKLGHGPLLRCTDAGRATA